MMAQTSVRVCEGQELQMKVPAAAKAMQSATPQCPRPINIVFNGKNGEGVPDRFVLTEKLLSQHLMLIGGIGSGKTNTFNQILQNIVPQLSAHDVIIIFDTMGISIRNSIAPETSSSATMPRRAARTDPTIGTSSMSWTGRTASKRTSSRSPTRFLRRRSERRAAIPFSRRRQRTSCPPSYITLPSPRGIWRSRAITSLFRRR